MSADRQLSGIEIVWTGTRTTGHGLIEHLERAGGRVSRWPLVEIVPRTVGAEIGQRLSVLGKEDWVLFTSAHAVRALPTLDTLAACVGAVGPETAQALRQIGWSPELVAEPSTAAALARAVGQRSTDETKAVFLKGARARPDLERGLAARGIGVEAITVYDSHAVSRNRVLNLVRFMESADRLVVVLGSPMGVATLAAVAPAGDLSRIAEGIVWACLGPTTRRALKEAGACNVIVPDRPIPSELCERIMRRVTTL